MTTTPLSSSQLHFDSSGVKVTTKGESSKVKFELEIMIFLRDRTTLRVMLEDGQFGRAMDFIEIVFQAQKLPPGAKDVFSLWLISPLLELRLKPGHQPYELAQQWEELCDIYTDANEEALVLDEPMLYFQRNVFYPLNKEIEVSDVNTLLYLYHEAKYNVLEGRYVVANTDYHRLAGIQALIHLQHYDPQNHVEALYRANLDTFYPHRLCMTKGWFGWKKSSTYEILARQLADHHRAISEHHKNDDINSLLPSLYRQYLAICWTYPFYGAAFFRGTIDEPVGRSRLAFLRSDTKIDVELAINMDGVCVVDKQKDEVLLSVAYTHLSWEMSEGDEENSPLLLLQFTHEANSKLLTIYSMQAKLMNALIESCVNIKKREMQDLGEDVTDFVEKEDRGREGTIKCDFTKIGTQLDKLCLCTYSPSGEKLD